MSGQYCFVVASTVHIQFKPQQQQIGKLNAEGKHLAVQANSGLRPPPSPIE